MGTVQSGWWLRGVSAVVRRSVSLKLQVFVEMLATQLAHVPALDSFRGPGLSRSLKADTLRCCSGGNKIRLLHSCPRIKFYSEWCSKRLHRSLRVSGFDGPSGGVVILALLYICVQKSPLSFQHFLDVKARPHAALTQAEHMSLIGH